MSIYKTLKKVERKGTRVQFMSTITGELFTLWDCDAPFELNSMKDIVSYLEGFNYFATVSAEIIAEGVLAAFSEHDTFICAKDLATLIARDFI